MPEAQLQLWRDIAPARVIQRSGGLHETARFVSVAVVDGELACGLHEIAELGCKRAEMVGAEHGLHRAGSRLESAVDLIALRRSRFEFLVELACRQHETPFDARHR